MQCELPVIVELRMPVKGFCCEYMADMDVPAHVVQVIYDSVKPIAMDRTGRGS